MLIVWFDNQFLIIWERKTLWLAQAQLKAIAKMTTTTVQSNIDFIHGTIPGALWLWSA